MNVLWKTICALALLQIDATCLGQTNSVKNSSESSQLKWVVRGHKSGSLPLRNPQQLPMGSATQHTTQPNHTTLQTIPPEPFPTLTGVDPNTHRSQITGVRPLYHSVPLPNDRPHSALSHNTFANEPQPEPLPIPLPLPVIRGSNQAQVASDQAQRPANTDPIRNTDHAFNGEVSSIQTNTDWVANALREDSTSLPATDIQLASSSTPNIKGRPPVRPVSEALPASTQRSATGRKSLVTSNNVLDSEASRLPRHSPASASPPPAYQKDHRVLWYLPNARPQPLPLMTAILASLTNKTVIHSLGANVVVEVTNPLDIGVAAQQITTAQSRFDPAIQSQFATNHIDRPTAAFFGAGIPINSRRDEIEYTTRLTKDWSTGATTSVGYEPSLAYLFFPLGNGSGLNPSNSSDLLFQAVQPLMRGAGRTANLATIRLAENRLDQSRLNVDSKLQQQVRSIEQLYWQLHASHVRRNAISEAITVSDRMVDLEQKRWSEGRAIYSDVARVKVVNQNLIQQKLDAERAIQRQSLELSQLAGLGIDEHTILEPVDIPDNRLIQFDRQYLIQIAMTRNPTLISRRMEIAVQQSLLQVAKNQLSPQLDLRSAVRSSGLQDDLGGALKDMTQFEFVDFTFGLAYTRPIGNRAARSKYAQAKMESIRAIQLSEAFETQVSYNVTEALNNLNLSYAKFESALQQLADSQQWITLAGLRYQNPPEELGPEGLLVALVDYQSAIQSHINAIVATADAIADYNGQIVALEELKGTLLERWSIAFANLPPDPSQPPISAFQPHP